MARIRLHIHLEGEHTLGPGKIQLLEWVRECGSISAAARAMEMAYRHAWELIDDMNCGFGRAVVETDTGGRAGGGARLTPFGKELVRRFRAMEVATERAIARDLRAIAPAPGLAKRAARKAARTGEARRAGRRAKPAR